MSGDKVPKMMQSISSAFMLASSSARWVAHRARSLVVTLPSAGT